MAAYFYERAYIRFRFAWVLRDASTTAVASGVQTAPSFHCTGLKWTAYSGSIWFGLI